MFLSVESFTADFVNSVPSPPARRDEIDLATLWRVLDEIDYGIILVTPEGYLQRANHLGRHELGRAKFLRVIREKDDTTSVGTGPVHHQLQANDANATTELQNGVRAAARGRRQMLTLHSGVESLTLACVPLCQPFEGAASSVLLMLARKTDTANLALGFFARNHKLTSAEEGVLRALCQGHQIADIASSNGVVESTVRAQIRALREKTRCNNIRLLVQQIAALPPVVPVSLSVQSINK